MDKELRLKLIELFDASKELGESIICTGKAIEKHEKIIIELVDYLKDVNGAENHK